MSQVRSRKLRRRRRKEANKTLRRKVEIRVDGPVLVICTWHSKFCHCFRDFVKIPNLLMDFSCVSAVKLKFFWEILFVASRFFGGLRWSLVRRWFAHNQCSWDDHLPKKIIWTMVHTTKRKMSWTLQDERYQRWVLLHCYLYPFIVYIFRSGFQIYWDMKDGVGEFWKYIVGLPTAHGLVR